MNKAAKHIQNGANILSPTHSPRATDGSPKTMLNSIMNFLPDNRPITALQIVEDYERCPKNFIPINRSYDQDADADLWRENTLFGRQTTRYLCLSKTEGLPDYVVETLKVIAEKIAPPKEFSLLSRTADTEQKAWRKRQIAYKLSKRGNVAQAVTDIILCSKLKIAPDGFKLAGDINGVLVCYKTSNLPVRLPPPVPSLLNHNDNSEVEKALNRLNLNQNNNNNSHIKNIGILDADHDYEEIQSSYQIKSPHRPAPKPPNVLAAPTDTKATNTSGHSVGTLGSFTEVDGVPFVMNPLLEQLQDATELPTISLTAEVFEQLDYNFQLERQILCTMKSSASKNPFFQEN